MDVLVRQLDAFVEAWESAAAPPDLNPFLPEAGEIRRLTLVELIKVDLEYRWLSRDCPKRIREYLAEFPELAQARDSCDLIYEEFHIRKQSGQEVSADEYLQAFPGQSAEIATILNVEQAYETSSFHRRTKQQRIEGVAAGDTIDDFELLAELGAGAFAKVFLARQKSMQRTVAVKISADQGTEPQTLAQLDHDHIVRVYDQRLLPERKLRLLYMQYIAGGTLQQVIQRVRQTPPEERTGGLILDVVDAGLEKRGDTRPTLSPARHWLATATWPEAVCWIGSKLARALDYSHKRGVLHRDVKPANVLLTAEPSPKLADFNISFSAKVAGATPAAYFGGSLAYMSPEQLEACNPAHERSADDLDGRSDIYSLGVLLWELLTGHRPFSDDKVGGRWSALLETMVAQRRKGVDVGGLNHVEGCPGGLLSVLEVALEPGPRATLVARAGNRPTPGAVHQPQGMRAPFSAERLCSRLAAEIHGPHRLAFGRTSERFGERVQLRAQRVPTDGGATAPSPPAFRANPSGHQRHCLCNWRDRFFLSRFFGLSGSQTMPDAGTDGGPNARHCAGAACGWVSWSRSSVLSNGRLQPAPTRSACG